MWECPRIGGLNHRITLYPASSPQIPDEVTDYYLQKSGFECGDPRLYVVRVSPRMNRQLTARPLQTQPPLSRNPKVHL